MTNSSGPNIDIHGPHIYKVSFACSVLLVYLVTVYWQSVFFFILIYQESGREKIWIYFEGFKQADKSVWRSLFEELQTLEWWHMPPSLEAHTCWGICYDMQDKTKIIIGFINRNRSVNALLDRAHEQSLHDCLVQLHSNGCPKACLQNEYRGLQFQICWIFTVLLCRDIIQETEKEK